MSPALPHGYAADATAGRRTGGRLLEPGAGFPLHRHDVRLRRVSRAVIVYGAHSTDCVGVLGYRHRCGRFTPRLAHAPALLRRGVEIDVQRVEEQGLLQHCQISELFQQHDNADRRQGQHVDTGLYIGARHDTHRCCVGASDPAESRAALSPTPLPWPAPVGMH